MPLRPLLLAAVLVGLLVPVLSQAAPNLVETYQGSVTVKRFTGLSQCQSTAPLTLRVVHPATGDTPATVGVATMEASSPACGKANETYSATRSGTGWTFKDPLNRFGGTVTGSGTSFSVSLVVGAYPNSPSTFQVSGSGISKTTTP